MHSHDDPLVGKHIAHGRYHVVNVLGRGGMGTVYTALQRPVDRKVALKIIHRELAGNPEIVARFLEEMRLTAAIEHPHTVRVYDFGDIDGQPFLTTEFLQGRSLRDEILRTGQFSQDRVASIAVQIAKALRAAKAHGVVHRDLKPENIMLLDVDGEADYVKVLDFGIARSLHRTTDLRTGTGALLGTPAYMSPEQCEGKPVDGRSDLYTLGLIAYELATGSLPFPPSDSVPQLLIAHVALPAPDVRPRAPQLGEPLAAIIMRLLAKSPDERFRDAEALIAALEPMVPTRRLSARATAATEVSTPAAPLSAQPLAPPARTQPVPAARPPAAPPPPPKRSPLVPVAAGLAVALAVGWLGFTFSRRPKDPAATATDHALGCASARPLWSGADDAALSEPQRRERLEKAVALCPTSPEARALLGRTLGRLGEDEAAEAQLRKAIELAPAHVPARFNLAVVLLKRSRGADALPLLDGVLADEPRHPRARLLRGQVRLDVADARGAAADLEEQTRLDPGSVPAWRLLARARQALSDPEGAAQAEARARALAGGATGGAR
jgi:tetratricopeptide (TPR) repeat protein